MYIDVDLDEFTDEEIASYVASRDSLFDMVMSQRAAMAKYMECKELAEVNRMLAEWNELMAMAS